MDDSVGPSIEFERFCSVLPYGWLIGNAIPLIMKHLTFLASLTVLLVVFSGCTSVTFQEPMPLNHRDLKNFPKHWRGDWMNGLGEQFHISEQYVMAADTTDLQILGTENRLRRFQDCLVLNHRDDAGRWEVVIARRRGNTIEIYGFDATDDARIAIWQSCLMDETGQKQWSSTGFGAQPHFHLNPQNNSAWRQMIKKGGLTIIDSWVRLEP